MVNNSDAISELKSHERFDVSHLADRLSGRGDGLRTSKPKAKNDTGLEQFVWRMARFHSGADTSIPVTATFWLQDWIDTELNTNVSVTGIIDDDGKEFLSILDDIVDEILINEFNLDSTKAAREWKGKAY